MLRPATYLFAVFAVALFFAADAAPGPRGRSPRAPATRCEGARPPLPHALFFTLDNAAFPGADSPDVAVHVPPGFDAARLPGAIVYFHGWWGCVAAALADEDRPCVEAGYARTAAGLAAQVDEAGVNALLLAVELRVDATTGEPGDLAMPGRMRALLREVITGRLAGQLGCELEVDALDRIVVVAHSGGYQAAASALEFGDLPGITEVVLLDGLYGADAVFDSWVRDSVEARGRRRRFVDLYTCCGGTLDRSRALAELARREAWRLGDEALVFDDDGDGDMGAGALAMALVFKRVATPHGELPRVYLRAVLEHAGFARISHGR